VVFPPPRPAFKLLENPLDIAAMLLKRLAASSLISAAALHRSALEKSPSAADGARRSRQARIAC